MGQESADEHYRPQKRQTRSWRRRVDRRDWPSADKPPVELPEIELYETEYGYDGQMYATATARQGGDVKVKLLPTSPTNARWLGIHAQIQKGIHVIFHGSYRYDTLIGGVQQSWGWTMRGGVMKMAMPGMVAGANGIWTFAFEQIIPDFTAANFNASIPEV